MEPDAVLDEIRSLVRWSDPRDMARLCDLIDALDNWLVEGGALPTDWTGEDADIRKKWAARYQP